MSLQGFPSTFMMKTVQSLERGPGALRYLIVGNTIDGYFGLEREVDIPGQGNTWEHKTIDDRDCRRVLTDRCHITLD